MKVLMVHNYYRQRGGEDIAFERDVELLRARGHEVSTHTVRSDDYGSLLSKALVLGRMTSSRPAYRQLRADIRRRAPDVVHVHNFFPVLTPSVHFAARDGGVPSVQSLRNYRLLCPGSLLWREDGGLEPCVRGSLVRCVLRGCYRGSPLATLATARVLARHRRLATWSSVVDHFVAVSEFVRQRHVAGGIPADRITVRCDCVPDVAADADSGSRAGALFVGRLSTEKGVRTLLAAWDRVPQCRLTVVGSGPLENEARASAGPSVDLCGAEPPEQVGRRMRKARFLVLPSTCYEAGPLVIIEAFRHGLPVIASRLGAMAEMVTDGTDGLLFEAGNADDLAAKARWAAEHGEEMTRMGEQARATFERRFSPDVSYASLMHVYHSVVHQ